MGHLALFWLLAILQVEPYWYFPASLSTYFVNKGAEPPRK